MKLLEGKCEACRADAPLVTPEERKTLMPQIPGWDVIEVDGIEPVSYTHLTLPTNREV